MQQQRHGKCEMKFQSGQTDGADRYTRVRIVPQRTARVRTADDGQRGIRI
jgi:hypothetical protein